MTSQATKLARPPAAVMRATVSVPPATDTSDTTTAAPSAAKASATARPMPEPAPVTNAAFTKALGAAVHRPAFFPVPPFAIGLLLGEGSIVVVEGQRVLPEATHERGYAFLYPTLGGALEALVA